MLFSEENPSIRQRSSNVGDFSLFVKLFVCLSKITHQGGVRIRTSHLRKEIRGLILGMYGLPSDKMRRDMVSSRVP
jgi:hypothetical protein